MSTDSLPPTAPSAPAETPAPVQKTNSQIIFDALLHKKWEEAEEVLKKYIPLYLSEEFGKSGLSGYNPLLFLDQSNTIGEDHADRIYTSVCSFKKQQNILLIIGSRGGRIEPAYLISKNCKAVSKEKFVVAVPRRAKSAATLLALGADEIHMGAMSELGPIDPQLGQIPALSMTNALQTLAKMVSEHPGSADMFAKYLQNKLDLGILGYFERINESAIQYASRLLAGKAVGSKRTPNSLASHLVNHYKDHSFVIDKDEALELFGSGILKVQSKEYSFANEIDQSLRWFSKVAKWVHEKEVTYVGSFDTCLKIKAIPDKE